MPKLETVYLYVRIPGAILPIERGERFEEPLDEYLTANQLGEVSGGGTMLAEGGGIEYTGIDVDVYEPERAVPLIIAKLKELGVPDGSSDSPVGDQRHEPVSARALALASVISRR